HQPAICITGSSQHIVKILIVKREWLLDKHMLARSEGALRQFSMCAMARRDDNQVCRAVVDHFIRTRDSCAKTVLHSDFARSLTRDQMVSFVSSVEIETMRDQWLDIHAATGYEIEKGFDVATFGPAHVGEGIIVTPLFVLRIIAARPIGFRNAERQLTLIESL